MRRLVLLFVMACSGGATSSPPPMPVPAHAAKILVNVDDQGVILGGNDALSYRHGEPAPGDASVTSSYQTATYQFASAESKAAFDADPTHLAPAFGGYCAFAASQNRLSPSDPAIFVIQDGELLVFTNEDFRTQFMADPAGNKRKAEANWPRLVEQYGK